MELIQLKGGHTTTDRRLDRLWEYDERNKLYLVSRRQELPRKPRGYTWSVLKTLDQGEDGACVGFSITGDAIARPWRWKNLDNTYAKTKVYWRAQQLDEWAGGSFPGAYPFYEGTSVLAGGKAAVELGHFKEYNWAYDVETLAIAVGYYGPAILGCNWHEDMFEPDENGFIHPTGYVAGGHAILIFGVSPKHRYFRLKNSWGESWGELNGDGVSNGTCKVSYDAMEFLLSSQGEALIPIKRARV